MSIMSYFPFVTIDKKIKPDFFINVLAAVQPYKNNSLYVLEYTIADGESAEDIADKLYDDVDYDFLIYAINDMINPLEDWPMSYQDLLTYTRKKYENINEIVQYRSIETDKIVDINWPSYDRYPLTAFEYEINKNDSKRNIVLLTPIVAQSVYRQVITQIRE